MSSQFKKLHYFNTAYKMNYTLLSLPWRSSVDTPAYAARLTSGYPLPLCLGNTNSSRVSQEGLILTGFLEKFLVSLNFYFLTSRRGLSLPRAVVRIISIH